MSQSWVVVLSGDVIREALEGWRGLAAVMLRVIAAQGVGLLGLVGSTAGGGERENREVLANNLGKRWEKTENSAGKCKCPFNKPLDNPAPAQFVCAEALTQDPRTQHLSCNSTVTLLPGRRDLNLLVSTEIKWREDKRSEVERSSRDHCRHCTFL